MPINDLPPPPVSAKGIDDLPPPPPDFMERAAGKILPVIRGAGDVLGSTIGKVSGALSGVTAPLRTGIASYQKEGDASEALAAAQAKAMGDGKEAPSWTDIGANMGLPTEGPKIPIITKPFAKGDDRYAQVSPAEVYGGVMGAVTDPTMYLGGPAAGKATELAGEGLSRLAPEVESHLKNIADQRSLKAVTGQNKRAVRDMLKSGELGDFGETVRSKDEAGSPIVGPLSRVEDIAPRAEAKRQFYGQKIEDVANAIDQSAPKAVSGEAISQRIADYKRSIPETPNNNAVRNQLDKQIEYYKAKGDMSFADAQTHKGTYKFSPTDSTTQVLGQDATNATRKAVSDEMDHAAESLLSRAHRATALEEDGYQFHPSSFTAPDGKTQTTVRVMGFNGPVGNIVFEDTGSGLKEVTSGFRSDDPELPVDALKDAASFRAAGGQKGVEDLLGKYSEFKKKYGAYRFAADKSQDRVAANLSNRLMSPTDYAMGSAAGVAGLMTHGSHDPVTAAMIAGGVGANKLLRSRGPAMAARVAGGAEHLAARFPDAFRKWLPRLQAAEEKGNNFLVLTHNLLMQSDPDYRATVQGSSGQ